MISDLPLKESAHILSVGFNVVDKCIREPFSQVTNNVRPGRDVHSYVGLNKPLNEVVDLP